ncbi:hypothetical protein ACFZAR_05330 [Streptomyces sp. NPDC008222]|uniref:hypothetical protein n=1 Tax=Streptomyces sp. NPDC008222 TaxID=3364820 RepID=UPI0036E110A1
MTDRLSPQREAEIAEHVAARAAALTAWLNKFSPLPEGQREVENAETVLEEDVPDLLAELAAVRKERDEAREAALNEAADWFTRLADSEPTQGYRAQVMRGAANDIRRLIATPAEEAGR